ncbi:MAG: tetratricopeptide repeat protein [Candidatus Obscuribacterales bacterium]|nr:tetratricopeptide repeat protein [Candidatus Obscuribacterales bacterium]
MKSEGKSKYTLVILTTAMAVVSLQPAIGADSPVKSPAAKLDSSAPGGEWERLHRAGNEALDTGRYGDAERLFKQSLIKSAAFGEKDIRFAKSLGDLGRLYSIRARFSEAEPLLEEEFHIKKALVDDGNGQIIPSMGSLIRFHLEHGTATKADPLTEQLLSYIEGRLSEYRKAAQGPITLKKGQPLTAWAGVASPTMRDPVIDWAITCDGIGNEYRSRGNFELADRLYKAALDVKETVLGKEHLSLANSFDSLGTICLEKDQTGEAENYFRYALEHTERVLPDEPHQVFPRIDKLAKCLIKEKKFDEAEHLYSRALDFWKKEPSHNGSEARTAYALGSLYVEEKKYDAAAPMLKSALSLAEEYYGSNSISLVPYLKRYADTMYYLGQETERTQLKDRANTIAGVTSTGTL